MGVLKDKDKPMGLQVRAQFMLSVFRKLQYVLTRFTVKLMGIYAHSSPTYSDLILTDHGMTKNNDCNCNRTASQENCSNCCCCCNGTSYNPSEETCCVEYGTETLTKGLSERMSQCCGPKAYNPLNEICCEKTVKPKPSHGAKCCGSEPYDSTKELCCGGEKTTKLSAHSLCCYGRLYNPSIENCCQDIYPRIQLKVDASKICKKNLTCCRPSGKNQCERFCNKFCDTDNMNSNENCTHGAEWMMYQKKDGLKCCGLHYYNTSLWSCENEQIFPKSSMTEQ